MGKILKQLSASNEKGSGPSVFLLMLKEGKGTGMILTIPAEQIFVLITEPVGD